MTFKFFLVFSLLIILIILGVDLGLSIFTGIFLLVIFFGIPLKKALILFFNYSTKPDTLRLLAIVVLIIALGEAMKRAGYFKIMLESLQALFKDQRLVIALPPALIGLLPMPAGALVSAPMVEEVGKRINLSGELMHLINYWFRHLWEYSWPLYQGLVLACFIVGIPIHRLAVFQAPMIGFATLVGTLFLLMGIKDKNVRTKNGKSYINFIVSLWPILVIFFAVLLLRLDLLLVLALLFPAFILTANLKGEDIKESILKGLRPRTLFLLLVVMVFKGFLVDTGILVSLKELLERGFPIFVPLFFLPFIVAILTGVNIAYISITFPILSPLIEKNIVLLSFAYISGFMGILLSPTHLCLAMTIEYFKVKRAKLYFKLFPMVLTLFTLGVLYLKLMGL